MFLGRVIKRLIGWPIRLSVKGFKTGPHLSRYYMYEHLKTVLASLDNDNTPKRILAISHSRALCALLKTDKAEIVEANFPEYNILHLPFPDGYFDYVVSDQVLEHVEGSPQQAIDETSRILKNGGVAVHTTCFLIEVHGSPKDFWRFTADALILLCRNFSKIIDAGSWGNNYALFLFWLGLRFCPVPHASWHPLHKIAVYNDKFMPIVTWIVAKK